MLGNPVGDILSFSLIAEEGRPLKAALFSAEGKQLISQDFVSVKGVSFVDMQTSSLPAGIYFLKRDTPTGLLTRKGLKN